MLELGLSRISRLMAKTPMPWRAIHVAGTNGKGSICLYISAMLEAYNQSLYRRSARQSKLKHAMFTTPHLIDRWDSVSVGLQSVSDVDFEHAEGRVLARNERDRIGATEFELLTATAFEIFSRQDVDVAVVEVGLGGRLDATNIIGQPINAGAKDHSEAESFRPPPLVTAISKIGLDHQALLGNTLLEIAREKAGIMKPGVPVVIDSSNDSDVYQSLCNRAGDRLVLPPSALIDGDNLARSPSEGSSLVHLPGLYKTLADEMRTNLPQHINSNAHVAFQSAWTALQRLQRIPHNSAVLPPDVQDLLNTLALKMLDLPRETRFPGRQDVCSIEKLTARKLPVLLDGAHNEQSAEVLATCVDNLRKATDKGLSSRVTWVLAASYTKDLGSLYRPLLRTGDNVFAVEFGPVAGMPWVKPAAAQTIVEAAHELAPCVDAGFRSCGKDVLYALRAATKKAEDGPLVIAGSLYLVGDVLRLLRDESGPARLSFMPPSLRPDG